MADFFTEDMDRFLAVGEKSRRCKVFIDESGETIGRGNSDALRTATGWRHLGHSCHFLVQAPTALNPVVRRQWSGAIAFRIDSGSAETLARELTTPELALASKLGQFEYLEAMPFRPVRRGRVEPFRG